MADWTDELAVALGVEPLGGEDAERLLGAARDVAHRVERKATPLAAFLLGVAVERRAASGVALPEALTGVLVTLEAEISRAEPGPTA